MQNLDNIWASDILVKDVRKLLCLSIEAIDAYFDERSLDDELIKDILPILNNSLSNAFSTAKDLIDANRRIIDKKGKVGDLMGKFGGKSQLKEIYNGIRK